MNPANLSLALFVKAYYQGYLGMKSHAADPDQDA